MIRFVLLKFFIPVYEVILQKYVGVFLVLKVRNSILTAKDYSPLLSDLDLAAVGDFSETHARKLRFFHEKLKFYLLFLGEIEIYSTSEWEKRHALLQELEPHYSSLRLLRKIPWMVRLMENSAFFPGLRARRGLERSVGKLGMKSLSELEAMTESIGCQMARDWKIELPESSEAFEFYHPWLEVTLNETHKSAYLLAAVFPTRLYRGADQQKIDNLRRTVAVKKYLKAFSQYELITMTAGVRGFEQIPEWYQLNVSDLKYWSAPHDT